MLFFLLSTLMAQATEFEQGAMLVCEMNQKKLVVEVVDAKAQSVHVQYYSEGKIFVDAIAPYARSGYGIDIAIMRSPPFQALIDNDLKSARVPRSGAPIPCLLSQPIER